MKAVNKYLWLGAARKTAYYYEKKQFNKALEEAKKSLKLVLKVYNPEHINTAKTLYNLVILNNELCNYDEALKYGREVLRICEKIWGKNDPELIEYLEILVPVYENMGNTKAAEEALNRIAKLKKLGGNNKDKKWTSKLKDKLGVTNKNSSKETVLNEEEELEDIALEELDEDINDGNQLNIEDLEKEIIEEEESLVDAYKRLKKENSDREV